MPGTTAPRGYPYPLGADPVNVAVDIQRLAEAIDDDVAAAVASLQGVDANLQAQITNNLTNLQAQITALDQVGQYRDFHRSADDNANAGVWAGIVGGIWSGAPAGRYMFSGAAFVHSAGACDFWTAIFINSGQAHTTLTTVNSDVHTVPIYSGGNHPGGDLSFYVAIQPIQTFVTAKYGSMITALFLGT